MTPVMCHNGLAHLPLVCWSVACLLQGLAAAEGVLCLSEHWVAEKLSATLMSQGDVLAQSFASNLPFIVCVALAAGQCMVSHTLTLWSLAPEMDMCMWTTGALACLVGVLHTAPVPRCTLTMHALD